MADGVVPSGDSNQRGSRNSEAWFAYNCRQKFEAAPKRIGSRTLLRVERRPKAVRSAADHWTPYEYAAVIVCDCTQVNTIALSMWINGYAGQACQSCTHRKYMGVAERDPSTVDARSGDAVRERRTAWIDLPTEQDVHFKLFMQAFPEGATLEDIADFYGLTRERIRQIEAGALAKLKRADALSGDGQLRTMLEALRDRESGPRGRCTGIESNALTIDELPTVLSP